MESLRLLRPPRDDDELYQLVQKLWGVTIPRGKHCPEHNAPFEAFSTAFFGREPQVLVRGSRGLSGKTAMMSALGLTQAVVLGTDTNIVGGSEQQALNALAHMKRYWGHPEAPTYMIKNNQTQKIRLTNNAEIQPLTASEKSVRGPHPPRLLLDEIDEMDANILESAKGQPMPQANWLGVTIQPQTIMVSTLQYADGTMMQEMRRMEEEGLPVMEWCYKDTMWAKDGWLDENFVEQKKREVSRERWRVEYELGEPSIGNRAIDSAAVEKMFSLECPEPIKLARDFEQYEYEAPKQDRDYVIAADWAQAIDYTVITVWDVTYEPVRCVYYLKMNRRPYPFMVGWFDRLQKKYNYAEGIHDATGLGRVVADILEGQARGFVMAGRERDNMLSDYVAAVERGQLLSPRIPSFYRDNLYASVDDLYARGKDFHLPDSVCSAALAWKLVSHKFPAAMPVGFPKTDVNWIARQLENNEDHLAEKSHWMEGEVHSTADDQAITFT